MRVDIRTWDGWIFLGDNNLEHATIMVKDSLYYERYYFSF